MGWAQGRQIDRVRACDIHGAPLRGGCRVGADRKEGRQTEETESKGVEVRAAVFFPCRQCVRGRDCESSFPVNTSAHM